MNVLTYWLIKNKIIQLSHIALYKHFIQYCIFKAALDIVLVCYDLFSSTKSHNSVRLCKHKGSLRDKIDVKLFVKLVCTINRKLVNFELKIFNSNSFFSLRLSFEHFDKVLKFVQRVTTSHFI